ncbi:SPOR domain-containing protein [Pseudaestuariivita atlantica]|uniref:SPOR domain-containing protein n=1 Tax=Pseudaestuariivita atlantica TaxID=1317121 RepID=A0A0L1JVS7_9RHOB|nr:SPOR domain-containing protein [Pseudaestuariivita atlantica]KNG95478.1 hypothetical protein ATO11_02445 [Pseudaestuariivita atlantica]
MAELSMQGTGGMPVGRTLGTAATFAGAVISFALLGGVGVWGYQLVMRDVSGVPVVRAIEGPMREAPEDPGGVAADHQGLSVNQVAGQGAAQPAPDRLLLAPRQAGIEEADAPGVKVPVKTALSRPEDDSTVAAIEPLEPLAPKVTQNAAAPAPRAPSAANATIQALADQIASGVAPLSDTGPADTPPVKTEIAGAEVAQPEAPAAKPVPKGALARSLRPQLRPKGLRSADVATVAAQVASSAATLPAGALDVDPATIPAGTRLVQLGAFDSAEVARSEWERLSSKFDAYLDGKQRVVQRAKSGGRVFYRLRAMGFADLSDARRFCSALTAQRADCIPVVTR